MVPSEPSVVFVINHTLLTCTCPEIDRPRLSDLNVLAMAALATHIPVSDLPPNVFKLAQTAQLEALYTIIRDKDTSR